MKAILILLIPFISLAQSLIHNPKFDGPWLPVTYYFNATFDVIQNPNWFSQKDIGEKHSEVWRRVKNPDKSIRRDGGYERLVKDEIFSSRVLPNIGLHTLGASYDTRHLTEYFEYYETPYAPFWSFLLTFAAHVGNEALETSQTEEINSHDHIIDLYFFDVLGYILSFHDPYMKFMLNDMGMKAWHFQPSWDFKKDDIFNAGLNYIYRPSYFNGDWRPILYTGMQNMGGVSHYRGHNIYSMLAGIALTNPLKQKGRFVVGLFHEKNDLLQSSLLIGGSENYRWRFNFYPHFWRDFLPQKYDLGIVVGENNSDQLAFGLSLNLPIGFGYFLAK